MSTLPILRVTLLGDFAVACGEEQIPSFATESLQSLLAFLIVHRHAPQSRQRLAFLLWPDSTEAQARTNLRRELHHLRSALPRADRYFHVDARTLQWSGEGRSRVDLIEFEAAASRAAEAASKQDRELLRECLVEAADLYGGDLLPGCYDAWTDSVRQRLRQSLADVLEQLSDLCSESGDYSSAIRYAERLLSQDSIREASYARLIELNRSRGDRAAALRVYERCEEVLEREMGIRPGPVTIQARDRALAAEPPSSGTVAARVRPAEDAPTVRSPANSIASDLPLIGREHERGVVRDWLERAGRCHGTAGDEVLLLLGELGIGKTRLLEDLEKEVRMRGGRTVRGRGFEAEMVRPYGAWVDALRSVPHEWVADTTDLGSLIPEIRGGADPADRDRLFEAFARWLASLAAGPGRVVVVMDDIQWLDEASVGLLHYLTRLQFGPPVLFACAARSGELDLNAPISRLLQALHRRQEVRALDLAPMERDEILALARMVDERADGERIFASSGGNPLFALELARAMDAGAASDRAGISGLIRARLGRLPPPARDLLSWAAALGRSFDPSTISLAAGQPLPKLLAALRQLEQHGLIRPAGTSAGAVQYDFAHDIVRDIAYGEMSEPRRRLAHLQIARTLGGALDPDGGLAGDVAHHAALGGDPALAGAASVTAANRCLRIFAYAEASELARRGIEHTRGLDEAERVHLHLALLRVAIAAGPGSWRGPRIEEELRRLIANARSLALVDAEAIGYSLISVLSYGHQDFRRVQESSIRAAEALWTGDATGDADPAVSAVALAQAGACLVSIERDVTRAEELLLQAEALARESGVNVIDVPLGLGILRCFQSDYPEATRFLERGWRLARRELDHFRACESLTFLVILELERDEPGRALEYCQELSVVAAKFQEGSEAPFARALETLARYRLARENPDDELVQALDGLRRMNAARKLAYVLTRAADTDLDRGRPVQSRDRAAEALAAARLVDHQSGIALAGAALVRSLVALDEVDRAREQFEWLHQQVGDGGGLSARARDVLARLNGDVLRAVQPHP